MTLLDYCFLCLGENLPRCKAQKNFQPEHTKVCEDWKFFTTPQMGGFAFKHFKGGICCMASRCPANISKATMADTG